MFVDICQIARQLLITDLFAFITEDRKVKSTRSSSVLFEVVSLTSEDILTRLSWKKLQLNYEQGIIEIDDVLLAASASRRWCCGC